MQFIDKVKIHLKAGNGGDGIVSFRHEKYVPFGGPNGGDGGNGGSIIFKVDTNRSTLLDLRYKKIIKAVDGERGKNKKMYGASGDDIVVSVPLGTIIKDANTNLVLADLVANNQQAIICQGGKGGKGNRHYATSRNTAPEKAQLGEKGEEKDVVVELKLLADVGLVGLPSTGKSTLLSCVSSARPEIADYPFTTLTPQLGTVRVDDSFSFVMADLPGLIEGASLGKGLGDEFLKHIERCRLLVHVLDMGKDDPIADYITIQKELSAYPVDLSLRAQLIVANKMDEDGAEANLKAFKKAYPNLTVFPTITLLKEGLNELLFAIKNILPTLPLYPLFTPEENNKVYRFDPSKDNDFIIYKEGEHKFVVKGDKIERTLNSLDLHIDEDALRFSSFLRKKGIDAALREKGCVDKDEVTIGKITFDFIDEE